MLQWRQPLSDTEGSSGVEEKKLILFSFSLEPPTPFFQLQTKSHLQDVSCKRRRTIFLYTVEVCPSVTAAVLHGAVLVPARDPRDSLSDR